MSWSKLPLKCHRRLSVLQVLESAKTMMVLTILTAVYLSIFNSIVSFSLVISVFWWLGWDENLTRGPRHSHGSEARFSWIHLCFYSVCRVRPYGEEHSTVSLLLGHYNKKEMIIINPIRGQKFNTHAGKYYILTAKGQIGPTGFYFSGVMNTTIINSSESLFVLAY